MLPAARGAGGVRWRADARVQLQQCLDEAGLASTAGGRNYKEISGVVHRDKRKALSKDECYSIFCTCSRICSIRTFMSTLMRVRSRAADLSPGCWPPVQLLDQEVQAFADFAALFQQAFDFIQMRLQPRDFFRHVDADGKSVASVSARSRAASGRMSHR